MPERVALYLQDAHPIRDGMQYAQYAERRGFCLALIAGVDEFARKEWNHEPHAGETPDSTWRLIHKTSATSCSSYTRYLLPGTRAGRGTP